MVGKKVSSAAKAPPKTTGLSGQRDLFHFYQKQPRLKDGEKAAGSGIKSPPLVSSSGAEAKPTVLKEGMYTDVSISEDNRKPPMLQMNGTISGGAVSVGVPPESQRLSPSIDSPLWGKEHSSGEPAKMSGDSAPHPSQAVIAVGTDKRSTCPATEAQKLGSFTKPPRNNSYAEVAGASISQEVFEKSRAVPGSSRAVGDDRSTIVQDRSSNTYETPSSRKRLTKENCDGVIIPDVIDLTVAEGDGYTTKLNPTSAKEHCVIIVDDDERAMEDVLSGSQGAPIDLSSSPKESRPARVLHPFFARQVAKKQNDKDTSTSPLITSTSKQVQVPWPGAHDQHNPGPQTFFSTGSPLFKKYRNIPASVGSPNPSDLPWLNAKAAQPLFSDAQAAGVESCAPKSLEHEAVLLSLPSAHREHPGISRFLNELTGIIPPRAVEEGEMWSQRWKPRRAAEVLGNEDNALYLKSWLQALALRTGDNSQLGAAGTKSKAAEEAIFRGAKRRTVVRSVVKNRGRKKRRLESDDGSCAEGWIVDDEEAVVSESDSNDEPLDWTSPRSVARTNPSRLHRERHPDVIADPSSAAVNSDTRLPEFFTLTNTILLAGPAGSGKSSTIYACAEELGWEVFEVHPGIGKRSGGNLSSLIGDVGKNHHVGRRGGSGTNTKRTSNLPGFGYLAQGEKGDGSYSEERKGDVRQSVILLDEVDVLFKEDANFWPTVVNIIKFSHRPIFMTCNEPSLIPQDDLPLQTCLHFKPCPSPLAVSFLQCVCLAEGHFLPREQLEIVYDQTYPLISCDEPEIPPVPYPSQQPPCSDLRQALNNLQFWCSRNLAPRKVEGDTEEESDVLTITSGITPQADCWTEILADWTRSPDGLCGDSPEESPSNGYDLYRMERHADGASYVDGYLERCPWAVLEALAPDRYRPSGDDEIGHTLLDKPAVIGNSKGLAFYSRDADMAGTALALSRHVFETSGAGARARDSLRGRERGSTRQLDGRSLRRARVAKQTLAVSFLDDVMTVSGPLLPRAPVILDYTPYVRQMILTDDVLEADAAAAGQESEEAQGEETRHKRGRPTRTRWRMGEYPRYITVSGDGLQAARNMLLGINP